MAETLSIRGHRDHNGGACRVCRSPLGYADSERCYISVIRTDTYYPRFYSYCIDCAVREGVAPGATRCAS